MGFKGDCDYWPVKEMFSDKGPDGMKTPSQKCLGEDDPPLSS